MSDDLYRGPLFSGLPHDEADLIVKACTEQTLKAGETVFPEGAEGDSIWIVKTGSVEAYKVITGDVDRTVGTFHPGDIFGEISFLDGSPRSAGARAVEKSTLLNITRVRFDELAKENTAVAKDFFERLSMILAERLRITTQSYKESVADHMEAIGADSLDLHSLAETFRAVTIYLPDGTTVTGTILGFENQLSGWALLIKNEGGTISLIPYASVVKIEVK